MEQGITPADYLAKAVTAIPLGRYGKPGELCVDQQSNWESDRSNSVEIDRIVKAIDRLSESGTPRRPSPTPDPSPPWFAYLRPFLRLPRNSHSVARYAGSFPMARANPRLKPGAISHRRLRRLNHARVAGFRK
jgi:hypothetical protein